MKAPLLLLVFASMLFPLSLEADSTPPTEAKPTEVELAARTPVSWQDDELCQFVFFAVLEGLYRDGIQNEVVDAIIGELVEAEENKVKTHFVFRCELCHATYEAFRAYRSRPAFMDTKDQSNFGEGIDLAILTKLRDEDAQTRIYAMGDLIRPWIMHRIEETRKTPEEKTAMKEKFEDYADEGNRLINHHMRKAKDEFYLNWDFYGSCQACEAAQDLGDAGF